MAGASGELTAAARDTNTRAERDGTASVATAGGDPGNPLVSGGLCAVFMFYGAISDRQKCYLCRMDLPPKRGNS
jgi:hypothetical protein